MRQIEHEPPSFKLRPVLFKSSAHKIIRHYHKVAFARELVADLFRATFWNINAIKLNSIHFRARPLLTHTERPGWPATYQSPYQTNRAELRRLCSLFRLPRTCQHHPPAPLYPWVYTLQVQPLVDGYRRAVIISVKILLTFKIFTPMCKSLLTQQHCIL